MKYTFRLIGFCTGILLIVLPSGVWAQQQRVDSIQGALSNASGMPRYSLLIKLSVVYWRGDNPYLALEAMTEAAEIAMEKRDTAKIVASSQLKAHLLNHIERVDEAEETLLKVLPMAEHHNDRMELRRMYVILALATSFQARYDEALDYNLRALNLAQELGDVYGEIIITQNIGIVYYKLKDYRKGLGFFLDALAKRRKAKETNGLENNLVNISLCHAYLNDFAAAKSYADTAFALCVTNDCSDVVLADANFSMGVAHFSNQEFPDAERFFLRAYEIAKRSNNIRFLFDNIDYLSNIYIDRGSMAKAQRLLEEAEVLIEHGAPFNLEKIKIYTRFSQLYLRKNDFQRAAHYQQKYIELKDSIYNEQLTTNLMPLEADYLERENKARIEAQTNLLTLNEKMIDRQRIVNILIGVSAILLLVVATVLYRSNRQRKRINKILDERVKLRTQELERNREELLQTVRRNSLAIEKIAAEMKALLSTIKGLCVLSSAEGERNQIYMHRVESTSEKLMLALRNVEKLAEVQVIGEFRNSTSQS